MAANIEKKVIDKLRVLPDDQQAEVLKFVEDLAMPKPAPEREPTSFLQVARSLHLQGPADWSSRIDDYLYGGAKLDEQ